MLLLLSLLACPPADSPPVAPPPPPTASTTTPATSPPQSPARGAPSHLFLIVLDTLRDDALDRARTPVLDALAARGDRVERAWSAGTWTIPGTLSLITGMPVRQHGLDLPMGHAGEYPPIPPVPTLAEVLHEHGFATTGLYANSFLTEELGFDRGFDTWNRVPDQAMPARLTREVAAWEEGQRQFLYLHLLATHSPLRPSEAARQRWEVAPEWFDGRMGLTVGVCKRNRREGAQAAYRAAYHAVVEDVDALVGELLGVLEPWLDDAAVVVTSDHGELLGEHGLCEHGYWVWEPLTHVPLIAAGLGELPDTLVTTSVPALATEALGVHHPWPTPARQATPLVSEREGKVALSPDGRRKAIWDEGLRLFDLTADPGEERAAQVADPELEALREAWEAQVPRGGPEGGRVRLGDETRSALRELGYLEGAP